MSDGEVPASGKPKEGDGRSTLGDDVFEAALDAWRREHDLWRRRVERADDQASALLAVDITALGALATVVGVVLDGLPVASEGFPFVIAGGACLLLALAMAALVRVPAWSVPKAERAEFDKANRTYSLWPFRSRGEPSWSPISDQIFLSEAVDTADWAETGWRHWLVDVERRRTSSLRDQVEKKEDMLRHAVVLWLTGALMAITGILIEAL
jgi:hypothetical protein